MSEQITDAELAELERLEAAAPGPVADLAVFEDLDCYGMSNGTLAIEVASQAEADVLVAARNALPGLLARLREAERLMAKHSAQNELTLSMSGDEDLRELVRVAWRDLNATRVRLGNDNDALRARVAELEDERDAAAASLAARENDCYAYAAEQHAAYAKGRADERLDASVFVDKCRRSGQSAVYALQGIERGDHVAAKGSGGQRDG